MLKDCVCMHSEARLDPTFRALFHSLGAYNFPCRWNNWTKPRFRKKPSVSEIVRCKQVGLSNKISGQKSMTIPSFPGPKATTSKWRLIHGAGTLCPPRWAGAKMRKAPAAVSSEQCQILLETPAKIIDQLRTWVL